MRYLLDVNALGFLEHEFHDRVAHWVLRLGNGTEHEILICPITEMGFVRVRAQAPQYGLTVAQSKTLLLRLKKQRAVPFGFVADDQDISHLRRQTTDGHLAELARTHHSVLAALDERIPSAFVIPE